MRFIRKNSEPNAFSEWKKEANEDWKPTWENLSDDPNSPNRKPKTALHTSLLKEQGYICCYCGRRIKKENSHIEHLKPRNEYPKLALDYSNLLASCPGYSEDEDEENTKLNQGMPLREHCGHKKGSWYDPDLMVSPLLENCADYFRYTALGEIRPTKDTAHEIAAQTTIQKLGLNCSKLEASRRKAIEAILPVIAGLSAKEVDTYIQGYEQLNSQGEYESFCSAILYFLKQYA